MARQKKTIRAKLPAFEKDDDLYYMGYFPFLIDSVEEALEDFTYRLWLLHKIFNCGLALDFEWFSKNYHSYPPWVETCFPLFDWRMIASSYADALEIVLAKLGETLNVPVENCLQEELRTDRYFQTQDSIKGYTRLDYQQDLSGMLIVPAQFGLNHPCNEESPYASPGESRYFDCGAFLVGLMLLTHPERLSCSGDPEIFCGGDVYRGPDAESRYAFAPSYRRENTGIIFDNRLMCSEHLEEMYSVTAFSPHV